MKDINISNLEEAATYTIYMIMGSYFKKAICKSLLKEKQLKIVYGETKRDNQIKLEERCINYIDTRIAGVVPDEIFDDMVEVHFVPNTQNNRINVLFIGFNWKLVMWAANTNRGMMFDYKFICNEDE